MNTQDNNLLTFIKKCSAFVLIFIIGIITLFVLTSYLVSTKANFLLDKNVNHVMFGNSIPECNYNDSIISNFKNFGDSGETYFYTYQKVKQIIDQNQELQSVFVEFNNHSIEKHRDLEIWSDKYMNNHWPMYSTFLSSSDYILLFYKNPRSFIKNSPQVFKYPIYTLKNKTFDYLKKSGGYRKINKIYDPVLFNKEPVKQVDPFIDSEQSADYNLHYLHKIISLCNKESIKVYLVRSPIHANSKLLENESEFQRIKNSYFDTIPFLDFKAFPLEDSEFGDLHHLNYFGSIKLSHMLNNLIADEKLNKIRIE